MLAVILVSTNVLDFLRKNDNFLVSGEEKRVRYEQPSIISVWLSLNMYVCMYVCDTHLFLKVVVVKQKAILQVVNLTEDDVWVGLCLVKRSFMRRCQMYLNNWRR